MIRFFQNLLMVSLKKLLSIYRHDRGTLNTCKGDVLSLGVINPHNNDKTCKAQLKSGGLSCFVTRLGFVFFPPRLPGSS